MDYCKNREKQPYADDYALFLLKSKPVGLFSMKAIWIKKIPMDIINRGKNGFRLSLNQSEGLQWKTALPFQTGKHIHVHGHNDHKVFRPYGMPAIRSMRFSATAVTNKERYGNGLSHRQDLHQLPASARSCGKHSRTVHLALWHAPTSHPAVRPVPYPA